MEVIKKQVTVLYFKDEDFEYELAALINIIDDLIGTDGMFNGLVTDNRIGDYLTAKNLIRKNIRGAYYSLNDKDLQFFLEKLYELQ